MWHPIAGSGGTPTHPDNHILEKLPGEPGSVPTLAGLHAQHSLLNLHIRNVCMQSLRRVPTLPCTKRKQLLLQLQLIRRQLEVIRPLPEEALEMLCPCLHIPQGAPLRIPCLKHTPDGPLTAGEPSLNDVGLMRSCPLSALERLQARPCLPGLDCLLMD
jgi:hypothetical protein